MDKLTYTYGPIAKHGAREINTFRGFGPIATANRPELPTEAGYARDYVGAIDAIERHTKWVADLVAPWRAVGLQLCEGVDRNFDLLELLEQWLAHIVQRPAERTNISFGLVGARQGVYKNAFFDPVRTILGKHNCIDDRTSTS